MAKTVFTEIEQNTVRAAIQEAEKNTSGEIKVHIENHCKEDALDRAAYIFEKLDLHETELRNGVLFYLAIKDKQFAILVDVGINLKVPKGFWDEISSLMLNYSKQGEFALGLSEGVKAAGKALSEHFPFQKNDINELSDDISFGDN